MNRNLTTTATMMAWLALATLPWNTLTAELLPTSGTMTGIYHQDRWGVGHLGFFIVHPELHDILQPYEDRTIRYNITKAVQPMNPGLGILMGLDEITVMPEPPLDVHIQTNPAKVRPDHPFQVVVLISNRSKEESLYLSGSSVIIGMASNDQKTGKPWLLLKDYTEDQMAASRKPLKDPNHISMNFSAGTRNQGANMLAPGASHVDVFRCDGVHAGNGELELTLRYATKGRNTPTGIWNSEGEYQLWMDVDTDDTAPTDETPRISASDITIRPLTDGWHELDATILPNGNQTIRVPRMLTQNKEMPDRPLIEVAGLDGSTQDGSDIPLQAERKETTESDVNHADLQEIPKEGVKITGRFRKQSRFAPPLDRINLQLVTDMGIESVLLTNHFNDTDVHPDTPFGQSESGVKLRIRPATHTFHDGDLMQFHFQFVNDAGSPLCWWIPGDYIGQNTIVEIDGKRLALAFKKAEYIGGWAATWTCSTPIERTFILPDNFKPKSGPHKIRYGITSDGGSYLNSNQDSIPMLKGEILSNLVEFAVE